MPQLALRIAGFDIQEKPDELRALILEGLPVGLALEPASIAHADPSPSSEETFADKLMEQCAAPLLIGLRTAFGTPALVIVANVAVQIEALLRSRSAAATSLGGSVRAALVHLASHHGVKARSIMPPVRPVDLSRYGLAECLWQRRVCCMANRLGPDLCTTCPLLDDEAAAASLLAER
jgi:ferric iron reductase protein FhuF